MKNQVLRDFACRCMGHVESVTGTRHTYGDLVRYESRTSCKRCGRLLMVAMEFGEKTKTLKR